MPDLNYVIGDYGQTIATTTYPTTVQSATIATSGFPVQITVSGDGEPDAGGWQRLQIYRDGTAISEILHIETTGSGKNMTVSMVHMDTPVAGTYEYSVKVINGSGLGVRYTESGQLSMIVEEKIAGGQFANNWLRRDINPPDTYYGYSYDYNSADSDAKWSIKKVSVSGTVETVTWSNGTPGSDTSIWSDRVDCFTAPVGPISLTASLVSLSGNQAIRISWSILSGVSVYNIKVTNASTGEVYTDDGQTLYNVRYNTQLTNQVFNSDSYIYAYPISGMTYSITVIASNVAGNVTESVIIAV